MSGWNLPPGVSANDEHINPPDDPHIIINPGDPGDDGPDYTNEDMLADLLRTALHGLKCYHEYGQAMRGIGKGYDWNEYPGETTLSFIQRAQDALKRMGK